MTDGPLHERATLHEKSVQKVAQEKAKKTRRRRGSSGSRSGPVTTRRWSDDVDDRLVTYVERHRVDHRRIQVVSPTEIIIWNPGAPRPG